VVIPSQYTANTTDWRGQLRKNERRTRWVIIFFMMLYLSMGVLIDLYLYASVSTAPLSVILKAILTFQVTPNATLISGGVAIVSLLITYALHDRIMLLGTKSYKITPESARTLEEKQLYNVIDEMKVAAGLSYMPKVYIIEADYMNAFASGYSEKSALVAITRGLLEKLDRSELQAVMAHELSHIRHHDIKLTLMASVLSNIILIVVDVLFYNVIYGRNRRVANRMFLIIIILRYVLPLITLLLIMYLSRTREYMADAGCVELMRDNEPLGSALLKIHSDHQQNREAYRNQYGQTAHEQVRRAAYLYDPLKAGIEPVKDISSLFSTHPSIKDRLKALGFEAR